MRKSFFIVWTLLVIVATPMVLMIALFASDSPASHGIPTIIILGLAYCIVMGGYYLIDKFLPRNQISKDNAYVYYEQEKSIGQGIPKRALANFIDYIILSIFPIVLNQIFPIRKIVEIDQMNFIVTILLCICIYFVYYFIYYFAFEKLYQATPGKMIVGIHVVMLDGRNLTIKAVFFRSIYKVIDAKLLFILSIISILLSDKKQSFGDCLAHTLVVGKKDNRMLLQS